MLRNIMAEIPKRKVKEFIRFSRLSSKNLAAFIPHPSSISSSIGVTALKAYRKVSNMGRLLFFRHRLFFLPVSRGRPTYYIGFSAGIQEGRRRSVLQKTDAFRRPLLSNILWMQGSPHHFFTSTGFTPTFLPFS